MLSSVTFYVQKQYILGISKSLTRGKMLYTDLDIRSSLPRYTRQLEYAPIV